LKPHPLPQSSPLTQSSLPIVLRPHKRHAYHLCRTKLLADHDGKLGALLVVAGADVAHGDVGAEGWGGDPGGYLAWNGGREKKRKGQENGGREGREELGTSVRSDGRRKGTLSAKGSNANPIHLNGKTGRIRRTNDLRSVLVVDLGSSSSGSALNDETDAPTGGTSAFLAELFEDARGAWEVGRCSTVFA
jgi:hypothetical protein